VGLMRKKFCSPSRNRDWFTAPSVCPRRITSMLALRHCQKPPRSKVPPRLTIWSDVPMLSRRMDERLTFRVPCASMMATIDGLLAHTPPSMRRRESTSRAQGKYVGAALVESATCDSHLLIGGP